MSLAINSEYTFTMRSPAILGASYDATLLAVLGWDTARALQSDLAFTHQAVLPDLPAGTAMNVADLEFYRIRTAVDTRVICKEWLAREPELIERKTISIMIPNASAGSIPLLRELLTANGFGTVYITSV